MSNDTQATQATQATIEAALTEIARNLLNIPTLKERGSDRQDFHEVSVWALAEALHAAYCLGRNHQVSS